MVLFVLALREDPVGELLFLSCIELTRSPASLIASSLLLLHSGVPDLPLSAQLLSSVASGILVI